jgi:hypothetical protein
VLRRIFVAILVIVVLAGALFALDLVVARMAEERAERQVTDALGAPADVTLHGWPVGLRLLGGRVARAEATARDVPLEDHDASLDRVDVTIRRIRVGIDDLRDPPEVLPPASSGTFEARLTGDATWALAAIPSAIADLRISDGAVRLRTLVGEASADVTVRDGNVLVVPRTPLGVLLTTDVSLDISDQPGRPVIEEAWIDGDTLVLRGSLTELGAG